MKFLLRIERIIKNLENSKAPFIYFVLTFFFITILRNFIEKFSTGIPISLDLFSHFNLSYIFLALALIILFHFVTKEKINKISKVVFPCFLILLITPIVDLIVSGGKGYKITYIRPEGYKDLLFRFITFFGSDFKEGITIGIRTEIALVLLGSFLYFCVKKRKLIKGLFFSFLVYCLIFIYLSMPFVVNEFLGLLNQNYNYYNRESLLLVTKNIYLLGILVFSAFLFYLHNKIYFIEILKDIRPLRLLHFELMFILGTIIPLIFSSQLIFFPESFSFYLERFFIIIAIIFAWLFAVITNNLADYNIDKISNRKRPLISKTIPKEHYRILGAIFFLLAVIFSAAVNFKILFLIILFIGNYFLYSMPPLRLKKIPFFSKLLISLNSLVIVMVGYIFKTGNLESFPGNIILFFLIFLTAAMNFIDIKDYKGDKKAGIKTLPVIFGLRKSKIIIGFFFLISYIAVLFIIKDAFLLPFLFLLGLVQFFLINRKDYKERHIFVVYFLTIFLLIIYLTKFVNIQVFRG